MHLFDGPLSVIHRNTDVHTVAHIHGILWFIANSLAPTPVRYYWVSWYTHLIHILFFLLVDIFSPFHSWSLRPNGQMLNAYYQIFPFLFLTMCYFEQWTGIRPFMAIIHVTECCKETVCCMVSWNQSMIVPAVLLRYCSEDITYLHLWITPWGVGAEILPGRRKILSLPPLLGPEKPGPFTNFQLVLENKRS